MSLGPLLLVAGRLLSAIRKTKKPLLSQDYCVSQKPHQKVYRASLVNSIGDKILRGMNSALYFQIGKLLLFSKVLIFKPKAKERISTFHLKLLLWYHTKARKLFCPHIVAMQAVSGCRKDCDSFLTK
ncbi:hypothetical protein CHARACLAT_005995 [Characodon lateralis]|uniref:Secreted protein n=1 Tax=Characodon lateralis TaxID=208331 RepID=A0ABU7DH49_9TELE|nr:hypothetical protein [Characodon lateralis]